VGRKREKIGANGGQPSLFALRARYCIGIGSREILSELWDEAGSSSVTSSVTRKVKLWSIPFGILL